MRDASGSAAYLFTEAGQPAKEIKVISGIRYVTSYAYDPNGNLVSLTYPDGKTVFYTYNEDNQLSQVTAAINNQTSILASDLSFAPFGGLAGMRLANGTERAVVYDQQYRISQISAGPILNRHYHYDPSGNIAAITDNLAPEKSQTYAYDPLSRLTQASGVYGAIAYEYDPVGNRSAQTHDGRLETYAYNPGTNQLSQVTGAVNKSFAYDKTGNTIQENNTALVYNTANRLIKMIENNALKADYVYNGSGQRIKKTIQKETTIYHYDLAGNLIAISDAYGHMKEKYVYIQGERLAKIEITHEPLAVGDVDASGRVEPIDAQLVEQYLVGLIVLTDTQLIQADVTLDGRVSAPDAMYIKQIANGLRALPPGAALETIYYYHNDHLGTPVALTDKDGVKVWQADYLPFGEIYQEAGSVSQEFRFAGQYFDSETGFHYNYYRYYDPKLGRYLRPDPIGFEGGTNLYAYVQNNPIVYNDFLGLKSSKDCPDCPNGKWDIDVGGTISFGLLKGWSRSIVTFTCLSNGRKCTGAIDCTMKGVFGAAGVDWSIDWHEPLGPGRTISGYESFEQIENYTSKGFLMSAGVASTTGNNTAFGIGRGAGIAWLKCKGQYISCNGR